MIESAPIRVAPRSAVPGSIVVSAAISTSASIQVDRRVDDRHPGEHVALEDLVAGLGRRQREVGAVVDAEVDVRVRGPVGDDAEPVAAQHRQHVAEVVLAGRVVVGEVVERLHQRLGVEDVGAGVDLADREDLGGDLLGVLGLDDLGDVAGVVADDASVRVRVVELDRHHGGPGAGGAMGLEQRRDDLAGDQRVVAGEHDDRVRVADDVVRRPNGAAGAVGLGLDHGLGALGQAGRRGRGRARRSPRSVRRRRRARRAPARRPSAVRTPGAGPWASTSASECPRPRP